MQQLALLEIAIRLLTAVCFGGLVGWEREAKKKPAGLRTHMMVALGSATFVLAAIEIQGPGSDPGRIIQGVVTGIGFLGAGSILQSRGEVRGLTTAAGIWFVGAVGAATGAGYFRIAGLSLALALVILQLVKRLETRLKREERTADFD